MSQLEDGQDGQAGLQALLQVARADLVPHALPFLLLGNSIGRILFLLAGNYHVVNGGLIFRDMGDARSSFFDRSQILLVSFWPQVLKEEGEAGSQQWEEKPKRVEESKNWSELVEISVTQFHGDSFRY